VSKDDGGQSRMEEEGGSQQAQDFLNQGHSSLLNQEVQVFSGGEGTILNRAMFAHFEIREELEYEKKQEELYRNINGSAFSKEEKKELYAYVRDHITESLKSGDLSDVKPDQHETDESSVSYDIGGAKLEQTELEGGMFKFSPGEKFTGVLRVERRDDRGELLPDSADIIEYKDGKPVSVIPGPEGKTRVADFGLISREAGISVSRVEEKEGGISVSRASDTEVVDRSLTQESPQQKSSGLFAIEGAHDPLKDHSLVLKEGSRSPQDPEVSLIFKDKIFNMISEAHQNASLKIFAQVFEEHYNKKEGAIVAAGQTRSRVSYTKEQVSALQDAYRSIEGVAKELKISGGSASEEQIKKVENAVERGYAAVIERSVVQEVEVVRSRSLPPPPESSPSVQSAKGNQRGGR
jgi:hypothetical protein